MLKYNLRIFTSNISKGTIKGKKLLQSKAVNDNQHIIFLNKINKRSRNSKSLDLVTLKCTLLLKYLNCADKSIAYYMMMVYIYIHHIYIYIYNIYIYIYHHLSFAPITRCRLNLNSTGSTVLPFERSDLLNVSLPKYGGLRLSSLKY